MHAGMPKALRAEALLLLPLLLLTPSKQHQAAALLVRSVGYGQVRPLLSDTVCVSEPACSPEPACCSEPACLAARSLYGAQQAAAGGHPPCLQRGPSSGLRLLLEQLQ